MIQTQVPPSSNRETSSEAQMDVVTAGSGTVDLETLLEAWQVATDRLRVTHEALRGEVKRLSDELERKNRELARKNRLADLGQIASHVAHEVRNNLMPMTLYLSLLRRHDNNGVNETEIMDKLESGFSALEATVNDLLSFTADREPVWNRFHLRALLDQVCESLGPQLQSHQIEVELDVDEALPCFADRDMLRRALVNLVLNAIDAMPNGGALLVTGIHTSRGLEIEVADSGPGISDGARTKLFEPFYTTKSGGTGLGLSIVQRIAEVHGGNISVANCAQGGAAFTLCIPFRAMEAAA